MAFFAASTDSIEKNTEFARKLGVDYPLLSDPDGAVARSFGVLMRGLGIAKRWTFYIGVDGRILAVDRDVTPSTAGADVAARLAELKVAKRK